jgi:hypothetical protein
VVAEVSVERSTGKVKVDRVFVAHDCGQIINPDGLAQSDRRQRRADRESQHRREADVQPQRGHEPQLGKLSDPDVSQRARGRHRSDRPADRGALGAGEPTTSVVPSAIANAVYDAVGVRLRSVPFRPATVLAALTATPRN